MEKTSKNYSHSIIYHNYTSEKDFFLLGREKDLVAFNTVYILPLNRLSLFNDVSIKNSSILPKTLTLFIQ